MSQQLCAHLNVKCGQKITTKCRNVCELLSHHDGDSQQQQHQQSNIDNSQQLQKVIAVAYRRVFVLVRMLVIWDDVVDVDKK